MHKATRAFQIGFDLRKDLKSKMLNWCNRFSVSVFMDSHGFPDKFRAFGCLVGVGCVNSVDPSGGDMLEQLERLEAGSYVFGHVNYDYKNILEPTLVSRHLPRVGFPEFFFFIPEVVCTLDEEGAWLTISTDRDPDGVYRDIIETQPPRSTGVQPQTFKARLSRAEYMERVLAIKGHIAAGDCYELNFCIEGFSEGAVIDPLAAYVALNQVSPAPFSAFYRLGHLHMMCASPERFIRKAGSKLICQPIKGTAARGNGFEEDQAQKAALFSSPKERAENVMIVDLMRNDLARCCVPGSVVVDELFGIYTFPRVHQMISTVSGTLRDGMSFGDVLSQTFPMGSMTGAPKHKVMQLIDCYELSRRELFSGTLGYVTPDGDFDFNVVIRSLFYNQATGYLSYQSGGAITHDSVPEAEWDELKLKAWAMERIFVGDAAINSAS